MAMQKKFSPPLAMLPNPVLSRLSCHSDPIVLRSIEPFDVTLWYSDVPRTLNLLKISSDIERDFRNGFFAHCTQVWKFNRISMTIISKVAWKCIWCCRREYCTVGHESMVNIATPPCSPYGQVASSPCDPVSWLGPWGWLCTSSGS